VLYTELSPTGFKDFWPDWMFPRRSLYLSLYPRKRPFAALPRNDAMGQKRPKCSAANCDASRRPTDGDVTLRWSVTFHDPCLEPRTPIMTIRAAETRLGQERAGARWRVRVFTACTMSATERCT
jgi:hypothetical protein